MFRSPTGSSVVVMLAWPAPSSTESGPKGLPLTVKVTDPVVKGAPLAPTTVAVKVTGLPCGAGDSGERTRVVVVFVGEGPTTGATVYTIGAERLASMRLAASPL